MNLKNLVISEITNQIESSIPAVQDGIEQLIIEKLQSEEVEKEWATVINSKINLPLMNEAQEQELFEKMIDKGTDILAAVIRKALRA